MICPKCKIDMVFFEFENIELDFCIDCSGLWFDNGELDLLYEKLKLNNSLIKTLNDNINNSIKEKKIKCPRCSKKMNKITVGEKEPLILDSCPDNDGIWFDGGELKSFIEQEHNLNENADALNFVKKLVKNI